jgi:hypothetical protein
MNTPNASMKPWIAELATVAVTAMFAHRHPRTLRCARGNGCDEVIKKAGLRLFGRAVIRTRNIRKTAPEGPIFV